ncbi:LysR substrate-binding domain-containing protein [Paraburkholderia acidiphila]|uniref:LysR family transcriptional regulator n=1 Tax=Paraburkholderia acidiphila TaxID=2571747 RepID=A0A7Z2GA47_9BURK|nr:LysR substrate-binding domain-containing protein [Paraburkholderia acidiphila]QGZ57794.1 LysR family transcriptional regulator [Paraburkholderia acidiphila]
MENKRSRPRPKADVDADAAREAADEAQRQLASRLRLRHLNCFVAIAQERTLARAAARLHLSQPAVSKTLVELEQWAGARLVERGRNGAALTVQGERFLRYALDATRAVEASALALARQDAHAAPALRLGALPTVATALLPEALLRFKALRPQMGVKIHTDSNAELLRAVKAGELDLMVGRMAEPAMLQGVSFEYLYTESLLVVVRAGHPLANDSGAPSLGAVLGFPLVIAGERTAPRHHTEAFFETHGFAVPEGAIETQSASVARLIVAGSDAVWIVPQRVAQSDIDAEVLVQIDVPAPQGVEPIGILRRSTATLDEAIGVLAQQLRECAQAA